MHSASYNKGYNSKKLSRGPKCERMGQENADKNYSYIAQRMDYMKIFISS